MRADPDEHLELEPKRSRIPIVELLLAVAVIAGLVYFWFSTEEKKPTETVVEIPPIVTPAAPPKLPATPDIPRTEPTVPMPDDAELGSGTGTDDQPEPPPPLTPDDGAALLRQQLTAARVDTNLEALMNNANPVDVSAAFLDGLSRGVILRKVLPVAPPKQAFTVSEQNDTLVMSSASYERYDDVTDAVTALDADVVVNTFHTLRPLYEQAFEQLGLDPEDFDNAVIRTLDLILATPEVTEPIALKPKSVVYLYADPALEELPALQKQLLRTGPDNLRRIKQQARMLREGLLAQ